MKVLKEKKELIGKEKTIITKVSQENNGIHMIERVEPEEVEDLPKEATAKETGVMLKMKSKDKPL